MPATPRPSPFRLLLWPILITLAVSVARLLLQWQEVIPARSGGAFHPLGITWLALAVGAWLGWRLVRAGAVLPRRAMVIATVALLILVAGMGILMSGIDPKATGEAAEQMMRDTGPKILAVAGAATVVAFVAWTRLAALLLLYGLVARLTVLAITWFAKFQGWNTHYTKFGPSGIEYDMARTMESAAFAQLGFWVPFTIVTGGFCGTLAARLWTGRAK